MQHGSHVYPNIGGGWGVRQTGDTRARKRFVTREQALAFARDDARGRGGVVYVHDGNGRVEQKMRVD